MRQPWQPVPVLGFGTKRPPALPNLSVVVYQGGACGEDGGDQDTGREAPGQDTSHGLLLPTTRRELDRKCRTSGGQQEGPAMVVGTRRVIAGVSGSVRSLA